MSALVIDTSSWISYFAGKSAQAVLVEEALADGRLHLPAIVAAELLSGRMKAAQRAQLEDLLSDLPLIGTDHPHWFRVGQLRSALARKGISVSTPDAHVAQCAIDLGATLVTEDSIFHKVAAHLGLRLYAGS